MGKLDLNQFLRVEGPMPVAENNNSTIKFIHTCKYMFGLSTNSSLHLRSLALFQTQKCSWMNLQIQSNLPSPARKGPGCNPNTG